MARRLPKNVREIENADGSQYAAIWYEPGGRQRQKRLGHHDLQRAERAQKRLQREADEGVEPMAPELTGDQGFDLYEEDQRALERRSWQTSRKQWDKHCAPRFGDVPIEEITSADVRSWIVEDLRTSGLAAKTIRNVHGVACAAFAFLVAAGHLERNPFLGHGKVLPKVGKRKIKAWTLRQVVAMLTAPIDYTGELVFAVIRVKVALHVFAGFRDGEARNLRWRDLHDGAPLGRIRLTHQASQRGTADRPLKGARDEWTAERDVPVHAELAQLLTWWRREGFAMVYGYHPSDDDFLTPDWRNPARPMTGDQASKQFRRFCRHLGLEPQGSYHSGRRFFITRAITGGAHSSRLNRITHNPRGDVLDGYDTPEWAELCAVVQAVKVPLEVAEVVRLRAVSGGSDPDGYPDGSEGDALSVRHDSGKWWRRWESNPRPGTIQNGVYVRIPCIWHSPVSRPRTGSTPTSHSKSRRCGEWRLAATSQLE